MASDRPGAPLRIGFIGLGTMGAPMVRALAKSDYSACLYDIDQTLTERLAAETGGEPARSLEQIGDSSDLVIAMLPNAQIVRDAVMGGVAGAMKSGAIVVDMSSSYPLATRDLGRDLAKRSITLLDAPVSGGVRKAQAGALAIMLGGEDETAMKTVTPVLESMGTVFRTGPLGSGHATKALNNYVSAAGLAAACEAVIVGQSFGLDPETMIDVINASTGRNNSTENKMKPFVLNGEFRKAGFALELMAKDVKAAADLSDELGHSMEGLSEARDLWSRANAQLGKGADHTEIFKFLAGRS